MELKENRECKNSVFVDLFYEDETAEENDIGREGFRFQNRKSIPFIMEKRNGRKKRY